MQVNLTLEEASKIKETRVLKNPSLESLQNCFDDEDWVLIDLTTQSVNFLNNVEKKRKVYPVSKEGEFEDKTRIENEFSPSVIYTFAKFKS